MYNNNGTDGAYEFVEMHLAPSATSPYCLDGHAFTDGIQYIFPPSSTAGVCDAPVPPGGYYVLAKNPTEFELKYGVPPNNTVFGYSRALKNEGESIVLSTDSLGTTKVIEAEWESKPPWPVLPNGLGFSLVPAVSVDAIVAGTVGQKQREAWRISSTLDGSPHAEDPPVPADLPMLEVTEVLSHTDDLAGDWVEVYNPGPVAADLLNWYIGDGVSNFSDWRQINVTTPIPVGGYVTIEVNQLGFGLSENGEWVYLAAHNGTTFLPHDHGFDFPAADRDVTYGKYTSSVGRVSYPALVRPTPGAANAGPRSPLDAAGVAITEIMYHPPLVCNDKWPCTEYMIIENLRNVTSSLYNVDTGTPWEVSGLNYTFPAGTVLGAAGTPTAVLYLSKLAPAFFNAEYAAVILPNALVLGPFEGQMDNSGERLSLVAPGAPSIDDGSVPWVPVDTVRVRDGDGWPLAADGEGPPLVRCDGGLTFGDDPAKWGTTKGCLPEEGDDGDGEPGDGEGGDGEEVGTDEPSGDEATTYLLGSLGACLAAILIPLTLSLALVAYGGLIAWRRRQEESMFLRGGGGGGNDVHGGAVASSTSYYGSSNPTPLSPPPAAAHSGWSAPPPPAASSTPPLSAFSGPAGPRPLPPGGRPGPPPRPQPSSYSASPGPHGPPPPPRAAAAPPSSYGGW